MGSDLCEGGLRSDSCGSTLFGRWMRKNHIRGGGGEKKSKSDLKPVGLLRKNLHNLRRENRVIKTFYNK